MSKLELLKDMMTNSGIAIAFKYNEEDQEALKDLEVDRYIVLAYVLTSRGLEAIKDERCIL